MTIYASTRNPVRILDIPAKIDYGNEIHAINAAAVTILITVLKKAVARSIADSAR